jgi:hypothetical protein
MLVSSTAITSSNLNSTKSDSLALFLGGTALYPSDSYSGTLIIQAQATP